MAWYVYIIKSDKKRWYYVGSTNRLKERILEHNSGKVLSTKGFRPLELVYFEEFIGESSARNREKKLKDCRTEKESIISRIEKI